MTIRIEYEVHVLHSGSDKSWVHEKTFPTQKDAEEYVNSEKLRMRLQGSEYNSKILRVSKLMVYQTGKWHSRKNRQESK